MLDNKFLKTNVNYILKKLLNRGFSISEFQFNFFEFNRKLIQKKIEFFQSHNNAINKIFFIFKCKKKTLKKTIFELKMLSRYIKLLNSKLIILKNYINLFFQKIPNIPHISVPIGKKYNDNLEIKRWYPNILIYKKYLMNFKINNYVYLGNILGLDFEVGIKISGSKFNFMRGYIAKLYRTLGQFMLNIHTIKNGYTECYTPYIVDKINLIGTGQLPKFNKDMFFTSRFFEKKINKYLISTSEITLINSVRNVIFSFKNLPILMTSNTPCFRSEIGNNSKDSNGIIRQHQFDKVELVQITRSKDSYKNLNNMIKHIETILKILNLKYRLILLCSKEIGFSSAKTHDLEIWFPYKNSWIEVSSISSCECFQARRINTRYRNNKNIKYVHTLNGSGLAIGRIMASLIESYQQFNGDIIIPKKLRNYLNKNRIIKNIV